MTSLLMPRSFFLIIRVITKILGLGWNKASDTLFVIIPTYQQKAITKENVLSYVASI